MKKVICLILSLVLVLGMAVSAFAATSYDPTQNQPGNTFNPAPNDPKPDDYVNPGVTDIISEEENPNTGAPVFAVPAVLAVMAGAAVIGKRK